VVVSGLSADSAAAALETTRPEATCQVAVVVARQSGEEGRTLSQRVAAVERDAACLDGLESAVRVVVRSAKIVKWHRGSPAIRRFRLERVERSPQAVQADQWAVVQDRSTRVETVEQETTQGVAVVAGMAVVVVVIQWDKHGVAAVVAVRRMWPCSTRRILS
jgi:precorrin-6x reductase